MYEIIKNEKGIDYVLLIWKKCSKCGRPAGKIGKVGEDDFCCFCINDSLAVPSQFFAALGRGEGDE